MDTVEALTVYKKILAPFDGSIGSSKALRRALLMARADGAEVTVYSVDEHLPRYAPAVGEVEEEKGLRDDYFAHLEEEAQKIAGEYGLQVRIKTEVGHAAQSIAHFAQRENFDLVVVGHASHSGLWESLLGSTTSRVVEQANCDVLVVR